MTTRKPAAYLVNRAYIQGVPFYVDERVIVPRSLIGELVMTAFAEDNALIGDPERIASALDLCTGGGSLAILAARVFPNARIEAVDVSPGALEVAARNLEEHGLQDRIALKQGDLFAPVEGARFDLILTNPPYVDAAAIADFPPEYAAEPTARACRRNGRARHRAPDPERSAQAFDAERDARLRSGRGAPAARAGVPAPAVRLARHRRHVGRSVSFARRRFRQDEAAGERSSDRARWIASKG